ncbi:MAG: Uma2 family endonuclease [Deinococcales bacterium]
MYLSRAFELISVEDYLAGEQEANIKHEYIYGHVYAMAGASQKHNLIAMNIATQLYPKALDKGCRLFMSDMKLKANAHSFYYPDLMLVCDEAADDYFEEKPCFVIEILSKSTERNDIDEKLKSYLNIPSLKAYIIIDSQKLFIKAYYRQTDLFWEERIWAEGQGAIDFPCLESNLSFDEIYNAISFDKK